MNHSDSKSNFHADLETRLEDYFSWLRDSTEIKRVQGGREYFEITTPHLDRHNDCLQIYVRADGDDGYLLTDDRSILDDLEMSGCKLDTPKRKKLLEMTLNGFGVVSNEGAIEVRATKQSFPRKKHDLLQSMLAIDDMFALASPNVMSLFIEDVALWLDESEVRSVRNIKLSGKSGYDHTFDFVIASFKDAPERVIQTINRPSKESAEAMVFKWIDTRQAREDNSQAYALLNDQEQAIPSQVIDALQTYEIVPVSWSKRESIVPELAA